MRQGWKFALLLLVTWTLCQYATSKKKKQTKLLKKLSHVGHLHKASQPKTETGQKKNTMQPSHDQVAERKEAMNCLLDGRDVFAVMATGFAMQNPESLQASEADILNHLENFNKHYINNEMASETALLADNGIDDDSALKISNMAALPNGMPHGAAGANAAIKAKINSAEQDESTEQKQASNSPGGYDPNAYLYDANSWPEYRIHDSDYSNFHAVEMSNMNGENTDMPPIYNRPNGSPGMGFQNMGGQEGMEYPEGQKFRQGKAEGAGFNDDVKVEKGEALQNEPSEESHPQEISNDKASEAKAAASSGEVKPADNSEAGGENKEQSGAKPEAQITQQSPPQPKPENNPLAAAKNAASQKQQTEPQPQQQKQQQQQQAKSTPAKLAASVAQAAASLPPKAIASLVSSLVGGGKPVGATVGEGQGQIQKNVVRSSSQALIPQDVNPTEEATQAATQLHKVAMPKKH